MSPKIEPFERARPPESILKAQLDYRSPGGDSRAAKTGTGVEPLLTPKEAAQYLRRQLILACEVAHAGGWPAIREGWPLGPLPRDRPAPMDEVAFASVNQRIVVARLIERCASVHSCWLQNDGLSQYIIIHHDETNEIQD